MTKRALDIADRVDLLRKHGIENPKKWATIHDYKDPVEPVVAGDPRAAEEWQRLRDHHLQETTFLFEMLKEMVEQLEHYEADR